MPWHHRKVFKKYVHQYDYFLYLEDDVYVTASHLHLLIQDMQFLDGTRYLPSLIRVEHSMCNWGNVNYTTPPQAHDLRKIYLSDWWPSGSGVGRRGVERIITIKGREFMKRYNPFAAYYLLPQRLMQDMVYKPWWLHRATAAETTERWRTPRAFYGGISRHTPPQTPYTPSPMLF